MSINFNIEKVKSIFGHVSIETFIKYFEVFRENQDVRENSNIYDAFDRNGEPWGSKSRTSRASKGKAIFKQNLQITALDYIVNYSNKNRLSEETYNKAKNLLSHFSIETEKQLIEDIIYIEQSTSLNEETKKAMIEVRFGQSNYRNALIEYWEGCSITNCKNYEVLISSHIKPYRDCQNLEEKYDVFNGLLLTPNYDKLFDKFLISFTNHGEILISKCLNKLDLEILGINKAATLRRDKLTEKHLFYLDQHKENFEKMEITRAFT